MKNATLALAGLLAMGFSANAQADGFVCQANDGTLTVKVYNNTHAEDGVRNAAVMVLSDPRVSDGSHTIARFKAENSRLNNDGAVFTADVDLRYNDSSRSGEYVAGTRLGYVDTFTLDVDFSYGNPVSRGDKLDGTLVVAKRNGTKTRLEMTCARYLKN